MSDLIELLQIVRTAESACASVVKRPEDAEAREALMVALTPLAAGSLQLDPMPESLAEAQVFGDIVRTRITALAPNRQSTYSLQAIRHPAQNLLRILRRLARDLQKMKEAG